MELSDAHESHKIDVEFVDGASHICVSICV